MADSQDVTGQDDAQITHYGYTDDPTPDSNSARGIGDRENHLIGGYSVALTQAERLAKFGRTGKSTGQTFEYGGKTYRDDDTAPEANRRIDIYDPRGHEGSNPLSASRYGIYEAARDVDSPLTQFRAAHPEYMMYSDDAILESMRAGIAPELDKSDFDSMARKENGGIDIKNALNQPMARFKRSLGDLAQGKTDDELADILYQQGVSLGKIDPKIESAEDFKNTLVPPKDFVAQAYRFTKEVIKQVWPQTQETGLTLVEGAHMMQSAEAATNTLQDIFSQVYPKQDVSKIIQQYQGLSQKDREQKLANDAGNNPQVTQDLMTSGQDVTKMVDRMNAAFTDIDVKGQNQQAIDWAAKTIGQIDQSNPGFLPENQEKVAKLIAQMPGQVLISMVPGLREGANYVQLYKYNSDAIQRANPSMSKQEVDRRARAGADAQFPAQELLSLIFLKGGSLYRGALTNKLMRGIGQTATAVGVGAGTMTANQIIQNLEANRPFSENVGEAATSGTIMGITGRVMGMGANLSTGLLKHWLSTVAEFRRGTGTSEMVSTLEPKDINRYVNGGPNPVEQATERNAVDIMVDAGEKLVEGTHAHTPSATQQQEDSPAVEAFEKAIEARESGDINSARAFADQGMAIATPEEKQELNQNVADNLKVITGKENVPRGTKEVEKQYGEWTELEPWQTQADIPEGAQRRTDITTGATYYRTVIAQPKKESGSRYLGTNQAPVESATEIKVQQQPVKKGPRTPKSGEVRTRPDGTADLFIENGIVLNFPDIDGALSGRSTIRKARGRPWGARSSGKPGVQPVEPGQTPSVHATEPGPGEEPVAQQPEEEKVIGEPVPEEDDLAKQLEASIQARQKPVNPSQPEKTSEGEKPHYSSHEEELAFTSGSPEEAITKLREEFKARYDALEEERAKIANQLMAERTQMPVEEWKAKVTENASRYARKLKHLETQADTARQNLKINLEQKEWRSSGKLPSEGQKLGFVTGMQMTGESMREAKRFAGSLPGWHQTESGWNRLFAPERLGEQAEATAAIGKGLNAQERVNMVGTMRSIAETEQLNRFLDHGVESQRREAWWNQKSNRDLKQILDNVSNHVSNGATADSLFDYYNKVLNYQITRADRLKVNPNYIKTYFASAFKDQEAAKVWFAKQNRFPRFQDAIAAGLVPKTFNPERNLIAYSATLIQGIKEVEMMREMVQEGLAVEDDAQGKVIADKNKWGSSYNAANNTRYLLSDEARDVVSNMFETSALFGAVASLPTKWLGALKGMSSVKLSWSFFHPLHMAMVQAAETATELEARLGKGLARKEDFKEAFRSIMDLSTGAMLPGSSVGRYGRLVDAMTGKSDPSTLSVQSKTDYRDLLEMGLVPSVSHEREIAWANWLTQQSGNVGKLGEGAKVFYSWIIGEPIQKWMFGKVIPSLKVAAALRRRDTLLRYYGNKLRDPTMNIPRKLEYQKINRDIEGRFGEMFYDNLLWNRAAKQFGVSIPLSMGWTLGFWRVHGDAVVDLTNNALNMDKIAAGVYKNKEVVTNRMLYAANLYAMAMLSSGIATYVLTGSVNGIRDLFFPRIGKDKSGNDERIRTPFWAGEAYSLWNEAEQKGGVLDPKAEYETWSRYGQNKLNPGIQAIYQAMNNTDWKGQAITDDTNPTAQQWAEKFSYLIKQMFEPITLETVTGSAGQTPEGFVAGLIGFGPAPTWSHRTDFENTVMATSNQRKATPVDQPPPLGSESAHKHFKHLDAEHQVFLLEKAGPDFDEYFSIASSKARELWAQKHPESQ